MRAVGPGSNQHGGEVERSHHRCVLVPHYQLAKTLLPHCHQAKAVIRKWGGGEKKSEMKKGKCAFDNNDDDCDDNWKGM